METALYVLLVLSIVAIVGYLVTVLAYRIWEARQHGLHWIEDDPEDEAEWQEWSRRNAKAE